MKKILRFGVSFLIWLTIFCVTAYGAAAIYFCAPLSDTPRAVLSGVLVLAVIGTFLFSRTWKARLLLLGPLLVLTFGWYLSLKPKFEAPWAPDVARLPEVTIDGDTLTVRNIRNFRYRSDKDFDIDYYDKTYNLNEIRTVDLFLSYWGTTSIAHTIMSFGFANGDYLPISIETRKEVGEEYSAVRGFFRQFELIYVIADERDFIGVRVNHRNEDVYLYRLRPNPEEARRILLSYLASIEELEHQAQFYNALTTNCTTSILPHIRALNAIKFNWALIANGYIDRWRYDEGIWGFEIPFEEFRKRSNINEKVKQAYNAEDFSARIRAGLPSIKSHL